ncbi:major royal jelly protein 3-like isoform X2 [Phymastichus coffea]|uniref:major royal jelly protein 3-like isoform X2 n=1 Tax=Phymastichus coffea TaxID=108790 RepID=UPI00273C22C3|nr:major royal jelly protein 3-like isoform X2 [Phymastichus coffea]
MRLTFAILLFTSATLASSKLKTIYEWKYIDYMWESPAQKERYLQNGEYDYTNIVPIDVDKARDGRVFVTVIRNRGVPASLGVVTDRIGPSGPLLKPYPNWYWYKKVSSALK